MGRDTYYDILGVSRTASVDEIKTEYRNVIRKVHPDVDGPAALFRQVQEAYEVLSDPVRRASYDRWLDPRLRADRIGTGPGKSWSQNSPLDWSRRAHSTSGHRRKSSWGRNVTDLFNRHPAGSLAMVGAVLLVFGAALTEVGLALILLGVAALLIAGVAGLGGRGAKEREAYQRLGMKAVDAMTGRQFEVLLENFFANKGYRVAHIGGRRGEAGRDLLLNNAHGRVVVQARRWNRVVRLDAVQEAIVAKAHYGADRVLVVTSSDYSPDAVTVANSQGVILWNRSILAVELTAFRGEPFQPGVKRLSTELQAGSRICLGFFAVLTVTLIAARAKAGSLAPAKRSRQ